ncbi:MAG TPA: hypothetical protein VD971_00535 [Phycisphaerales bacterium]|nr:hypothetical protein [Phycisphaerales bacterium]
MAVAMTASAVAVFMGLCVELTLGHAARFTAVFAIAGLLIVAQYTVGCFRFTVRDTGLQVTGRVRTCRIASRALGVLMALVAFLGCVTALLDPTFARTVESDEELGLMATWSFLWAAQLIAMLTYARWIASRIPDAAMMAVARRYRVLLPVLATVGLIFAGIGPIIGLLLWVNFLVSMRRSVQTVRADRVP